MKYPFAFLVSVLLGAAALPASGAPGAAADSPRITASMDANWLFLKDDATQGGQPGFDDSAWRLLDVPHDWSIEGPYAQDNATGPGGGYLPAGIGWYRKHFILPPDFSTRRVFIEFDGVMANSDVWINGFHLGQRPYGYISFRYEMTGHLFFGPGQTNVLAVRADNSRQPASRWYTGAGIYRHVRLIVTDPVHLDQWATFVSTPQVSVAEAIVRVHTTVTNGTDAAWNATVQFDLLDALNKNVGSVKLAEQKIEAGKTFDFEQDLKLAKPQLWDLEHPTLYTAVVKAIGGNRVLDDDRVTFGIRDLEFKADTGFYLNGQNMKLLGVCLHADGGAVGAAVPMRVWQRRLTILKDLGCNAIRTAHNPPAPEFLDLCDRMGFLVMEENFDCWTVAKNPYDYHLYFNDWSKTDERDMVRRDRNHPSIVLYSAGNEIHDTPNAEKATNLLAGLVKVFHDNDPTRPVTQALFRPNTSHDYDDGLADLLDVIGTNYRDTELQTAHEAKPTRKIIGTEQRHDRATWLALRDSKAEAGQFLWTGVAYLGEAIWPAVSSTNGLLDRTARPLPRSLQRQSWWSSKPVVHLVRENRSAPPGTGEDWALAHDWTPRNPGSNDQENVSVFSNCQEVELYLNGRSLGAKPKPADVSARTWTVPFESGAIKAVGRNDGKEAAAEELHTAGQPAKIVLTADHPKLTSDWDDVAFITAKITDAKGEEIPWADDLITFKLDGPGKIFAVDNGDRLSHESYQASERHAYRGECLAILHATGRGAVTLSATAANLAPGQVKITTVAAAR